MVRVYLALLLLAMAAGQLLDLGGFAGIIETYRIGPSALTWPLALSLVAGELVAGGALLLSRRSRRIGAGVAVAVATLWSALAVQAFARGLDLDNCGCFGVFLAQELRWYILVQDAVFVGMALWVWRRSGGPASAPTQIELAFSNSGSLQASRTSRPR